MVFLDIFSPEEYDALQLNSKRPGPLKVSCLRQALIVSQHNLCSAHGLSS